MKSYSQITNQYKEEVAQSARLVRDWGAGRGCDVLI